MVPNPPRSPIPSQARKRESSFFLYAGQKRTGSPLSQERTASHHRSRTHRSFPRKRESSFFQFRRELGPRFRGDERCLEIGGPLSRERRVIGVALRARRIEGRHV